MANSAEAQAWVSIGTNLPVKTKGVEKENIEEVVFKQEKDDDAGSEKQLHLDEDALQLEPFASDDFVTGDKFEQDEAQQNGHDTKEEPTSVENEKDKERDGESNSAKPKDEEEDVGHQTNSNNPQLVRCRIFVGHLNTDKCSRKDVEDLFAPFGKVLACSLQQGYGFVQYETEQSARKAIKELHGVSFFGMKLGTPLFALLELVIKYIHAFYIHLCNLCYNIPNKAFLTFVLRFYTLFLLLCSCEEEITA